MKFATFYREVIFDNIFRLQSSIVNAIFVIQGQVNLLPIDSIHTYLADPDTFYLDADETIFNKEWFVKVFSVLQQQKDYHLLSFAQFSYLISYMEPSFFKDRITIFKDNLRLNFPIEKEQYLEKEGRETIELRPERLPIYQSEQFNINGKYYYSIKTPIFPFESVELFPTFQELEFSEKATTTSLDVTSDPLSLDVFINECIENDTLSQTTCIKYHEKKQINATIIDILGKLNFLLHHFGGKLLFLEEDSIPSVYQVKDSTQQLLTTFWGSNALFRNISIYKNPNISNEIVEISQGLIVETIINEYENSILNLPCRDLFLTAPTGAGKSLLFQLPAFHISNKGHVTIVVSPLIALMKDQVNAIDKDRNFDKVAYINSELSLIDREKTIESCKDGVTDILYMSPELLLSYDITHFIGTRRIGLIVIDEAHLITTWGRDFRVDYWFLGNHIRKTRKYHNLQFPMVAVTATAIYGGTNDMVFDSIESLVMQNPHIFIGQVKRNDIHFIINNYENFTKNYEINKLNQTVDFIKNINAIGIKSLVYTPYTRHIEQILNKVNLDQEQIATGYHGSMDSLNKEYAYRLFKSGEKKIMISTKAFGMGVDIPDIQIVYHHAPSGLLPDYVQEIGRVARKPELKGYATLNYSTQDQRYTKALHGMSALRQYQIREVLKKILKTYYKNNKSRNLLLSVDDFGHIFEDAKDLDQKVLTSLMMIEKDYLAKQRFNVVLARPKKLFVKLYSRISENDLHKLSNQCPNTYAILEKQENGNNIIELDLDKLWYNHFVHKSFPTIKREYYTGKLFKEDKIELVPQLKMSFEIFGSFNETFNVLNDFLNNLQSIFSKSKGYFKQEEFQQNLNVLLDDFNKAEKLSRFILSSYSGRLVQAGVIEGNAFLQQRKTLNGYEYHVYNNQYLASFSSLLKKLNNLFGGIDNNVVERYVTNKESNAINYVRLGYFMEMMELGTFEIKGGENPMIFIRINDPNRIERDSNNPHYTNSLLAKTLERHSLSNHIFDHFFLRTFTDNERWDFIEDFFLGSDVDVLLNKYKGGPVNNVDIIEMLKNNELFPDDIPLESDENTNVNIFHPNTKMYYFMKDLLTIVNEKGTKTRRVSEWLKNDPISFDIVRRQYKLKLNKEVFELLVSKLRAGHPEYFKDTLGLKARIEFRGYPRPVQAAVPYSNNPVEFYKWWCSNPNSIEMTLEEKIRLFDKVYITEPTVLKKEHKRTIKKD